jgi:hypothetical protein
VDTIPCPSACRSRLGAQRPAHANEAPGLPPATHPNKPTCRETGARGPSHSPNFDQRRRPEVLRTAMATAFFCPTSTTSRLPRVTPV